MTYFSRANFIRKHARALFPLILAAGLCACAPSPNGTARLDLASQPQIFSNENGYYAGITVMVHPNANLTHKPAALFVPSGPDAGSAQRRRRVGRRLPPGMAEPAERRDILHP